MLDKFEESRKIIMSHTYSVSHAHVQMIKEMANDLTAREGKNISEGEVLRRAVDMFYAVTMLVKEG